MEKKTIGVSTLIAMGMISLYILIPGFFTEDKYFCEKRPELGLIHCDDFSKYIAENGKCIRKDDVNLICHDGWIKVSDDRQLKDYDINFVSSEDNIQRQMVKCNNSGCFALN